MKARLTQPKLAKTFAESAASAKISVETTRPFSIRLTRSEREALEVAAGAKLIGAFVRERLLAEPAKRKATRRPSLDKASLGQILATLGRSSLNASLAEIGAAARLGTIIITPDTEAEIRAVCADIQEVKRMLLRGLGFAEERNR